MRNMNTFIALCISLSLLLGGCLNMGNILDEEEAGEARKEAYEKENYVRIQDYKGEGYTLRNTRKETGQIAEANREELEEAVEAFFLEDYKTKVVVHNIVSAVEGVSVFVESVGEPHFYTFAIVPIDVKNKKVETNRVWSQEGQVENAIQSGLYAMVFEQEFSKLDAYLEDVTLKYPVVGTPIEAVANVMGTGYSTPYYFTTPLGDIYDDLLKSYLNDPKITKQEIINLFAENDFNSNEIIISIEFYMKEGGVKPDEKIYEGILSDIKSWEGVPRGNYSLMLNDNLIDRRRGIGAKENTLDYTKKEGVVKE